MEATGLRTWIIDGQDIKINSLGCFEQLVPAAAVGEEFQR